MFIAASPLAFIVAMLCVQEDEKGFEKIFDGESLRGLKFFAKGDPTGVWRVEGASSSARATSKATATPRRNTRTSSCDSTGSSRGLPI